MKCPTVRARTTATILVMLLFTLPVASQAVDVRTQVDPGRVVGRVRSRDGTTIIYERSGRGRPLVLVSSALADRSDGAPLAALLSSSFTVFNYDRRGRGGSGDAAAYAVDREIEDLEALLAECDGPALLFGSSSGAVLALEAAQALTTRVEAAALFEPPFVVDDSHAAIPEAFYAELGALVAAGHPGDAVAAFLIECVDVPAATVAAMMHAPLWAHLESLANTLPYDGALLAGLQTGNPLPVRRWPSVTARILVLDGARSPTFLRNAARALVTFLPRAEHRTLAGQDHSAPLSNPQALVPTLVDFLGGGYGEPAHPPRRR